MYIPLSLVQSNLWPFTRAVILHQGKKFVDFLKLLNTWSYSHFCKPGHHALIVDLMEVGDKWSSNQNLPHGPPNPSRLLLPFPESTGRVLTKATSRVNTLVS